MTGPPGAGKSTVAPLLAAAFDPAALVPGDDSSFWVCGGIAPWLPAAHAQNEVVVRAAAGPCGTFVRGGCPVVHDGVVGPWFLPTSTGATGLTQLHYAVLMPSLARCLAPVAGRPGHGFTDPEVARPARGRDEPRAHAAHPCWARVKPLGSGRSGPAGQPKGNSESDSHGPPR